MDKPNRAERRRNKFGGGRSTGHGGWPTVQPNPVFEADATEAEPEAGTEKAAGTETAAAPDAAAPEAPAKDATPG